MSSKIDPAKMNRIQRGSPKSLDDLPVRIQEVLKSIYQTCGTVGLYGSYANGDWAEDSDLDIGIKNAKSYGRIVYNIGKYHGIVMDIHELNDKYHLIIIK